MTPRHLPRDPRGFTLIELMVTIGILAIVLAVLTTVLFSSTRQSGPDGEARRRAGRHASGHVAHDDRAAPGRRGPEHPARRCARDRLGDSVNVRVRSDLNGDGVIQTAEPSEDVTYSYVDSIGVLTRNPGTGAARVISNVTDMRLTYYASDGSAITALPLSATDAARVTSIQVALTVAEDGARPLTITNRVNLRNR